MQANQLWPEITPFKEDILQVSDIHKIRYALYGNPTGRPVFFLHGGPGGGSDDEDARWFDPDKYLIVTHDQRGSGKSLPLAEIKNNTSQDLVADIEASDMEGKKKWCRILAEYEYSFFSKTDQELKEAVKDFESYFPEMRLNIYYQANRFFLEDRQILDNAHRLKDIDITLINGTRDVICPPYLAWELHKNLKKSELIFVNDGGHLSSDSNILLALLKALTKWD